MSLIHYTWGSECNGNLQWRKIPDGSGVWHWEKRDFLVGMHGAAGGDVGLTWQGENTRMGSSGLGAITAPCDSSVAHLLHFWLCLALSCWQLGC